MYTAQIIRRAIAEAVIRHCEANRLSLNFYYENIWGLDELMPHLRRILGPYFDRQALITFLKYTPIKGIKIYHIPQFYNRAFIYVNLAEIPEAREILSRSVLHSR